MSKNKEHLLKTLNCEKIGGRVPHFELVFFLTMESFGKVHPSHRSYSQWDQMSYAEQKLHILDMADVYIQTARKYDHSAIFVRPDRAIPGDVDVTQWLLETIREKTGDEYALFVHGDPTWAIPSGRRMMDFAVQMMEEPEKLNSVSEQKVEQFAKQAEELDRRGHLLDGFILCSDYCFNANPFFTIDQFEEFIVPYLSEIIQIYRSMGFYSIKHTDGNVMPILKQMASCKPNAIHSLDPQGGVNMQEARKIIGENIALMGNVNCGLLQTGTDEECDADIKRALREGMAAGKGYIFSTSNCAYPGLSLERYERMVGLWKEYGVYGRESEL